MGILDIFKGKKTAQAESNTMFGQTQLGNNVVYQGQGGRQTVSQQLLYVTTSSVTDAGRTVDMTMLSRNSTVMACVGVKARALAQLPIKIMYKMDDGTFVDALQSEKTSTREKTKAKQVLSLLQQPNNFQSQYEFWYQWCMWQDLAGECFTLWWRKNQEDTTIGTGGVDTITSAAGTDVVADDGTTATLCSRKASLREVFKSVLGLRFPIIKAAGT